MANTSYGYARVSTAEQNIERQIRNIISACPNAIIYQEVYTGRKIVNRIELNKLLKRVTPGDTIYFDSVSRMSRNSNDGFDLYQELYKKGINLVFLKEPHINTDTYKKALLNEIELTGDIIDNILLGINKYMMALAKQQIKLAFEQSQKEVDDLSLRTKEGIKTARLHGKQIGGIKGRTLHTKKSITSKEQIKNLSRSFAGSLKDDDVIKLTSLSRKTYYKYKKEIRMDLC